MTTWLEKLLAPDLLEAYLERGYALNFGYAVSADLINPEDPAKDLVAALDFDGPDGPLAGADLVHTLRFPLLRSRSEERRVGKECRSRWSPYH